MADTVQQIATLIDTPQVRVAEFVIRPDSKGDWHNHTYVKEYCVCLEGRILIERDGDTGVVLSTGQRLEIHSGVVHRLSNPDDRPSRYMVIQGIGQHDFISV